MVDYEERPTETQSGDIKNSINRYHLAAAFCQGKKTLDYACGYGYGTNVLQSLGINVLGVEPYSDIVDKARVKHPACKFEVITPDMNLNYDIVVALEIIEHIEIEDLAKLLERFSTKIPEIVASTPNGDMFRYKPQTKAQRVGYHVCHYTWLELQEMFSKHYKYTEVFGLAFDPNPRVSRYTGHMVYGSNK